MMRLEIGHLREGVETQWLCLNDGILPAGLAGARYQAALSSADEVEECIEIALQGTLTELRAILSLLEGMVNEARACEQDGFGDPLCLRVTTTESSLPRHACLRDVRLEADAGYALWREKGSLGLELIFKRDNCFDSQEIPLALINEQPLTADGRQVINHSDTDAGHQNWVYIDGSFINTGLPAPLRLELTNTSPNRLGELLTGVTSEAWQAGVPLLSLEAETGAGAVPMNLDGCSGGRYSANTWSGGAWTNLLSWDLSTGKLISFRGCQVTPLLRLAGSANSDGSQLRWQFYTEGNLALQSGAVFQGSQDKCLRLPSFRFPWSNLPEGKLPAQAALVLQAQNGSAGTHTLGMDDLQFLSGCQTLKPVTGLASGAKFVLDSFSRRSWSVSGSGVGTSHLWLGGGAFIRPGYRIWLNFFQKEMDGSAPIARTLAVKAWYRERRRAL